jgi:hypothetical protein
MTAPLLLTIRTFLFNSLTGFSTIPQSIMMGCMQLEWPSYLEIA